MAYYKHSYDTRYFKEINSPEKAYWLGFIAADGSVGKGGLRISISSKDRHLLDRFKSQLNATHSIKNIKQKSKVFFRKGRNKSDIIKESEMSFINIYGLEIVKDMENLGIIRGKRNRMFYPKLPLEFYRDFIRGYFDGDGSIYSNQRKFCRSFSVSFTGQRSILELINKTISNEIGIKESKLYAPKDGAKCLFIVWGGNKTIKKIYKYLYPSNTLFCLKRKKDRFLECENQIIKEPVRNNAAKIHRFLNKKNEMVEIFNLRQFCKANPTFKYHSFISLSGGKQKTYMGFRRFIG